MFVRRKYLDMLTVRTQRLTHIPALIFGAELKRRLEINLHLGTDLYAWRAEAKRRTSEGFSGAGLDVRIYFPVAMSKW